MRRSQAVPMVEFKDLQFSVAEELGKGAGGVVYKVKWFATDVAVKQLRNIRDISPIAQAELIREANVMVQLRHPNIIQFFGITCDKGGVFSLVMEYMEKGSLYDILHNRKEELTAPSLHIKLYKDMISGLAYLHSNKILHRDLKSLNVLVTKDMQAKLADFGLSTLKSEITNEEFVGTPRWMAPEQIPSYKGGPVCHSEKADIYSYGIILWELLSRKVPFSHIHDQGQILSVIKDGHRPEIPNNSPKSFASLISRCWQQQPEQRPSAPEVVTTLNSISDDTEKELTPFLSLKSL